MVPDLRNCYQCATLNMKGQNVEGQRFAPFFGKFRECMKSVLFLFLPVSPPVSDLFVETGDHQASKVACTVIQFTRKQQTANLRTLLEQQVLTVQYCIIYPGGLLTETQQRTFVAPCLSIWKSSAPASAEEHRISTLTQTPPTETPIGRVLLQPQLKNTGSQPSHKLHPLRHQLEEFCSSLS